MPLLDAKAPQVLHAAAGHLVAGELLAFPTETVYGLGARADDDAAVAHIFQAKGRPAEHPLIVHAASLEQARQFAAEWPPLAQELAQAFWPGPLTIIVERQPQMARAAAGGQASIGLRVPAHPLAQALLHEAHRLGVAGIAAPSANRFGHVSATTAAHVEQEFGSALWVLDGGECPGGIESAIVDCTGPGAVLLRPGLLSRARIEAVLGMALGEPDEQSPRASGTLRAHYAPRAKLRLMPLHALREALALLAQHPSGLRLAVYSRSGVPSVPGIDRRRMPHGAAEAAHELFAVLREFDAQGAQLIWVEQPPASAEWEGVRDRLERAAAA